MRPSETTTTKDFAMPSPQKSPRRVLGDLTPNAQLTPKHHHNIAKSPVKTTLRQSPLKAQTALHSPAVLSINQNHGLMPASASKKRRFSAIEGSETRLNAERSPMRQRPNMDPRTISPSDLRVNQFPPVTITLPTEDSDSSTDDESLVIPNDDQDHMDIPIPTLPSGGSFSSLVDYDPADPTSASQESVSTTASSTSSKAVPLPVTSHVELLKLRLRMAMYKLNTNQTYLPFAKLQFPHQRSLRIPEGETEDQEEGTQANSSPTESTFEYVHSNIDPQFRDDSLQNVVVNITNGPVTKLGLGPVLLPTAYSSRFIGPEGYDEPTFPPQKSPALIATRQSLAETITPIASPRRLLDEKDLTSSVVKGHAASGLLELMHAK